MELDRSILSRIDRKLLAGLGHDETYRMVRVPASEAVWSTWNRYCDTVGISMGRAIVTLVEHELRTMVEEANQGAPVFGELAVEQLARDQADLVVRKRRLDKREDQLRARDRQVRIAEQQIRTGSAGTPQPRKSAPKIGRNERCPCRSGLKYKHCHGLPGPTH